MKKLILVLSICIGASLLTVGCRDKKTTEEKIENSFDKAGDAIEEKAEKAGDAIKDGYEKTKDAVEDGYDKTKDAVKDATN